MTPSLAQKPTSVRPWKAIMFVVALLAAVIVPAAASSADEAAQSCWKNIDTGETQCFDASLDPIQQIEDATAAPVVAIPSRPARSIPTTAPASPAATYVLVILYDNTGFGGSSFTYFTTNSGICATNSFPMANIDSAWNDRVDSFQSFNNCQTTFYRNPNFGTPSYGPFVSSSNMGTFSNQASSLLVD